MDKIIINLVKIQLQLKILHWQTDSYAAHKAFGKTYEQLDLLIDALVEAHQGKKGKIYYETPVLELTNIDDINVNELLEMSASYISTTVTDMLKSPDDTDCANIKDEILAEINKLRYLLTLK